MKKISVLLCIYFFTCVTAFSQTQAEIDKMMKQAQDVMKKYGKDSTVNEAMKDAQAQAKQEMDKMKNNRTGNTSSFSVDKKDTAQFVLPSRNTRLLNALPIRTFNRAELISYLHNLGSKLTVYLRSNHGTDINAIPLTAVQQSGTPIGLWMKGSVNESVLVTIKAAELKPDNNLVLNNTGGILTSSGLGFYGIPILEYVLEKQPENNMILNNLGQAYLDLGDDKKAEQYLLKCIKSYKYYPDANLALAYIYNSRGQKSTAISYAENSLRGAWSSKAHNFLRKLKPDLKVMDYVRHRYKQPEYFNFQKYAMLPQCYSTEQIAALEPQYVAYKQMIAQKREHYWKLYSPVGLRIEKSIIDNLTALMHRQKNLRPFFSFGDVVLEALRKEYTEKSKLLSAYTDNYYRERAIMSNEHKIKFLAINGDDEAKKCKEINALSNTYLPLFAEKTEAFQRKVLVYLKDYLNDLAYWSYIASVNDDKFHVDFYVLVTKFLGKMEEINTTIFMEDYHGRYRFHPCEFKESGKAKADSLLVETPDCYLTPNIEVDLGAFKLEVNCETYNLEAGAGLVGKIEYARSSGNITLAFGVGAAVPRVFFKSPGIQAGLEAEAKSQVYITFNNKGTPFDMGVLWEAKLNVVLEGGTAKGSIGFEEGLTAGFGSGVLIKETSQLKQAIDKIYPVQPDDKQENKNVPLYKK